MANPDTETDQAPEPDKPPAKLSDKEAQRALWEAGIPAAYHRKDLGLQTLQPRWPAVDHAIKWLSESAATDLALGQCFEITADNKPTLDFTFLMARAMHLRSMPVRVISLPTLVATVIGRYEDRHADTVEQLHQVSAVFIVGAVGNTNPPYDDTRLFETEWFLRSLLFNNRSIILQGACAVKDCEWWSKGFRSLFAGKCSLSFDGPKDTVPKPSLSRSR